METYQKQTGKIRFYHGTDLTTAEKLVKLKAKGATSEGRAQYSAKLKNGKGEFGAGMYMTHAKHEAAHIAKYYTNNRNLELPSSQREEHWAVLQFEIEEERLLELIDRLTTKVVSKEDFDDYYQTVLNKGQTESTGIEWTLGPIKDRSTPYKQHTFSGEALKLISEYADRTIVLEGRVDDPTNTLIDRRIDTREKGKVGKFQYSEEELTRKAKHSSSKYRKIQKLIAGKKARLRMQAEREEQEALAAQDMPEEVKVVFSGASKLINRYTHKIKPKSSKADIQKAINALDRVRKQQQNEEDKLTIQEKINELTEQCKTAK